MLLSMEDIRINGSIGTAGQVLTTDGVTGMSWASVPQGPTGATGVQGPQGLTGPTGSAGGATILPYSRVSPLTPQTSLLSADASGNIYDLGDAFYIKNFGSQVGLFALGSLDLIDQYGGAITLNGNALDFGLQGQFACRLSRDGGLRLGSGTNESVATYGSNSLDMNFQNNNVIKLSSIAYNGANAGLFLTRATTGLGAYFTDTGVQLGVNPDNFTYTTRLTREYLKVDKIKDASSTYGTLGQVLTSDASGNIVWATGSGGVQGPTGPQGATGAQGVKGDTGTFFVPSGLTGQYLVSQGGSSYGWSNQLVSNTPIAIPYSYAVYSNGTPPMRPDPTISNTYPYDGWFYTNNVVAENIGWTSAFTNTTTVPYPSYKINYNSNSVKQMYVCFLSTKTTCSINLGCYTYPPTSPNYYKSRLVAVLQEPSVLITAGIPYIAYYNFSSNTYPAPQKYLHTPMQMVLAQGTGTQVGGFYGEDLFLLSCGSNTGQTINNDSFIVSEMGYVMDDGTTQPFRQPLMFNGSSVQAANSSALTIAQGAGTLYLTPAYNGYTIIPGATLTLNFATGVVSPPTVGLLGVGAGQFSISVFNPSLGTPTTITYVGALGSTTYTLAVKSVVVFGWSGTYLFP